MHDTHGTRFSSREQAARLVRWALVWLACAATLTVLYGLK